MPGSYFLPLHASAIGKICDGKLVHKTAFAVARADTPMVRQNGKQKHVGRCNIVSVHVGPCSFCNGKKCELAWAGILYQRFSSFLSRKSSLSLLPSV